jgi:hypothetical protein
MKRALALAVLVAVGASGKHHERAKGAAVSEHDGTVTIEIGSSDDFLPVFAKYDELVYAPGAPLRTLEIVLRPGTYSSLQMQDIPMKGNVSVRVRSLDPSHPAVLTKGQVLLDGNEITLEDLVLRGTRMRPPMVSLRVKSKLTIRRCVFIDNRRTTTRGGQLIRLTAGYRSGPKSLLIEDTWFIHNTEQDPSLLISFNVVDPDYFPSVVFERCVFAGNHFTTGVSPVGANEVRFHDCVLASDPNGLLIFLSSPQTQVVIDDSVVMTDDWSHFVRGAKPAQLKGCTVYAPAPPPSVSVDGPVRDPAKGARLLQKLEQLSKEPRPPTGAALRKALGL